MLNDFTLAQPTIDRHNRYRQHILAMEKRLVTNNFSFRFFTTLLGMIGVNAFFAHRHRFWNAENANFKEEMDRLALKLINNPKIVPPSGLMKSSPSCGRSSPGGSSDGEHHFLTPLKQLDDVDWTPGMQQRCVMCNKHTEWFCSTCTVDKSSLVPVCPEYTKPRTGRHAGQQIYHKCLSQHRSNPHYFSKGKKSGCNKRARMNPLLADQCEEVDPDIEDEEEVMAMDRT